MSLHNLGIGLSGEGGEGVLKMGLGLGSRLSHEESLRDELSSLLVLDGFNIGQHKSGGGEFNNSIHFFDLYLFIKIILIKIIIIYF